MVGSRAVTALVGVVAGPAGSVAAWVYFDTLLVFLVVPFVPLLRGGDGRAHDDRRARSVRRCPACGFATRNDDCDSCPRDGRRPDSQPSSS